MKRLAMILMLLALCGCAGVGAVLDTIYPPDPPCNQSNAGDYWDGQFCVHDVGTGYWRWIKK